MPEQVKKALVWAFWIFVLYAIVTSPDRAASLINTAWEIIMNGLHNIGVFFDRVLQR